MQSAQIDWGWLQEFRQWSTLKQLINYARAAPAFSAAFVVGSFAAGTADALSDLDLILVPPDDRFESAWAERHALHVTGALAAWDERPEGTAAHSATHKWVTTDVIYVECLIATVAGGFRLADPFVQLAGDPWVLERIRHGPPIALTEMRASHPVDEAYHAFVTAVRNTRRERS
jgi:hypothetical protein